MEALVSAVLGDLISRSISFAVDRCHHRQHKGGVEDSLQRLRRVLLRVQAAVEEAERRRITNQAMLRQLQLMREGMYRGYYVLSAIKRQSSSPTAEDHGGVRRHDHSPFALSLFNPAKRFRTLSARRTTSMASETKYDDEELREVLADLERMAANMKELVMFLSCYPPMRRGPYSRHLWLENHMFGREAEQERIIIFLLEAEHPGAETLGVLPVIGRARGGKSTLVEHVCCDERVRNHFSLIVFFAESDVRDESLGLVPLGDRGVIKHGNNLASAGKSLVVIEVVGDVDESTWRRTLFALREESRVPVSKIVITSRSEKIANFGTTQALELKRLPQEAYWYFFKTIVFGSTDPNEQPELASVCLEMADLLNGSFIAAYAVGAILRGNLGAQFWCKVLRCFKDHTTRHLLLFGQHPIDLIVKDQPTYVWRIPKIDGVLIAYSCYQGCSSGQQHNLPKVTIQDVHTGTARPGGKFEALAWRSKIPPYYDYLLSCELQTPSSALRMPARNKQTW